MSESKTIEILKQIEAKVYEEEQSVISSGLGFFDVNESKDNAARFYDFVGGVDMIVARIIQFINEEIEKEKINGKYARKEG